ncbi:carbohydrate ABC transporter permease [Chromobacterium violaceum]|uniref:Sn-glycerol-3-phosphate transport system permease protein ugpA n=1 Tax=Chromobacterium violaceum TaxID=536 RepID=A0AAX2MEW3_CHRVL|nr:sugar ABC transporter permease [Chromobacterium violaceum]MBP4052172.1 sugar ABC transporter permease [Chromobacterium violaceum]MBX9266033.1 sugar ABC transporter permease [Chromobacterium violaceum]OLZ83057.1 lactose ABC transporter permease [Chromobacterium violaceum]OQS26267.1 lactose ABC transporter permease [Chromobacterium violaceum]OQS46586.1 lactose ABC transporter permease [Chromobacterium violaceum]
MRKPSKTTLQAYLFLAPALLLLAAFSFWPVGFGSFLAFTRYNLIDAPQWVGLDNFRELFGDELFLSALKNSALYLLVVPIIQLLAMLLAVLVNNNLPGIKLFRAAYYLPVVTSVSVIGIIWNFMYTEDGVLNAALRWLHLVNDPVGWLTDDHIALFAVMFITVWRGIGWYMVLYLAGLQAIPADVYEAAQLDGAGRWQRFWRITVPLLAPTILLCSVMSVLAAVKAFEEVQILTKGGPMQSTYTALFYAYEFGIKSLNFGRALAASLVMSAFCIALAWLNFRYLQPRDR